MSLEFWNTLASLATLLVVAATAIAALVQLRHMRGGNQIVALSDLYAKRQSADFEVAARFVFTQLPEKMKDPAFRYQIANRAARTEEYAVLHAKMLTVGSYYEEMGVFVKAGLVDSDLVCDMHSLVILNSWDALADVLAILRRDSIAWGENFEYLAVVARAWVEKHKSGSYPPGMPRIDLEDKWLSADTEYAARLAPAKELQ